jgi:hypothetical protein
VNLVISGGDQAIPEARRCLLTCDSVYSGWHADGRSRCPKCRADAEDLTAEIVQSRCRIDAVTARVVADGQDRETAPELALLCHSCRDGLELIGSAYSAICNCSW